MTLDPGILFIVLNPKETERQRIFWKYMSPDFISKIDFSKASMTIKFNKEELLEAVERVSLLSPRDKEKDREITYSIIKLLLKNDQSVEISTENAQIGDAKEEIIPTGINSSETIRIGFSSRYLVEALRSFTSQEVTLNFSEAIRPFVISSEAEPNLCQLILPVRMD